MKEKDIIKDQKILDDTELEDVNGGLEMSIGLPNATKENAKKTSNLLQKGKKAKAGDLILREDSIKKNGPISC